MEQLQADSRPWIINIPGFPSQTSIASSTSTISVWSELPELTTHHCVEENSAPGGEGEEHANITESDVVTNIDRAQNDVTAKETVFELIRCDHDPPVKNAVFLLSAPNSLWSRKNNWMDAPPCNLSINLRSGRNRASTPLVQRLTRRGKSSAKITAGSNRYKPVYMEAKNTVTILKGELTNEEEILASLPITQTGDEPETEEAEARIETTSSATAQTPESTQASPQTTNSVNTPLKSHDQSLEMVVMKDRITFLDRTVKGLEDEVADLRKTLFSNEVVHQELLSSFNNLEKSLKKERKELNAEISKLKDRVRRLEERQEDCSCVAGVKRKLPDSG